MSITKKTSSENKSFWESTREARVRVEQWPTWKRNLKVSQFSVGFDSQKSENLNNEYEQVCIRDK